MSTRQRRSPLQNLAAVERAIRKRSRGGWSSVVAYLLLIVLLGLFAVGIWYAVGALGGWLTTRIVERGFPMELM